MRVFGRSCSQLESGHIKQLNEYASASQVLGKLCGGRGFYATELNKDTDILHFWKLNNTHKDTWFIFYTMLKEISNGVLTIKGLKADKEAMSVYLGAICDGLEGPRRYLRGNWLSLYRNSVNYKQEYGAWFPYNKNSKNFSSIEKYLGHRPDRDFNELDLREPDETLRYFALCA